MLNELRKCEIFTMGLKFYKNITQLLIFKI